MAKATKQAAVKADKGGKGKAKATPAPVAPPQHGNRGTPTANPIEGVAKKVAKGVQLGSTAAPGVSTRATVEGVSVCAVLRQLGYELYPAFTVKAAATMCAALGIPLRAATLGCQVGSGRQAAKNGTSTGHHGAVPNHLHKDVVKRLAKLAGL